MAAPDGRAGMLITEAIIPQERILQDSEALRDFIRAHHRKTVRDLFRLFTILQLTMYGETS